MTDGTRNRCKLDCQCGKHTANRAACKPDCKCRKHHRKLRGVTTYPGIHAELIRQRGRAAGHPCVSCEKQARDWAYTHDDPDERTSPAGFPFSIDVMRYQPMCHPCHQRYDRSDTTHCPQGHPYSGDNLFFEQGRHRRCRTCVRARNNARAKRTVKTPEQRARINQLQRERRAKLKA